MMFPKKLPVVTQVESSECGLACISMISTYYGKHNSLRELRGKYSGSNRGLNLSQLSRVCHELEINNRPIKVPVEKLEKIQLPCILHWEMNHFVVLKDVTKEGVIIHDPAVGIRKIKNDEVSNSYTGVLLEVSSAIALKSEPKKEAVKIGNLWSNVSGLKPSVIKIILISLIIQALALASPFYLQLVIDQVIVKSDSDLLVILAIAFSMLVILQVVSNAVRKLMIIHLSSSLFFQISSNLFYHLVKLPLNFFTSRSMGDITSRFGSVSDIKNFFTTGVISGSVDGVMAIITLFMMLYFSVELTFVVIINLIIYCTIRFTFFAPIKSLQKESVQNYAKEKTHFMEVVRAIQPIKLYQQESEKVNTWQNKLSVAINSDVKFGQWNIGFEGINKILFGLENVLVIYLAAYTVINEQMSLGMVTAFIAYKVHFVEKANAIVKFILDYKLLSVHLERLSDITLSIKEKTIDIHQNLHQNLSASLQVKGVSFAYSSIDDLVIEDINFDLRAGESVAIVGRSGSGKSTLAKILLGLLQPTSGIVTLNDKNIFGSINYRKNVSSVMQDDQLLSGSILDNISFSDEEIDMKRIVASAHASCIHEEIVNFPMNYNTLIGDMGSTLSGGQKQRILLARALYRRPQILILDEATSHLDITNEKRVNENIKKLNITRIIIAHRKETIASADRVISL